MSRTLTILGSGTPIPDVRRWGSSAVVDLGTERLMFDCGFSATYKLHRSGYKSTDIDSVFFTHHHSDHVADFPALLLSRFDMSNGTEAPLRVYGPRNTALFTERLIGEGAGAFWPDIVARISHPLSLGAYERRGGVLPRQPPSTECRDLAPGDEVDGSSWSVSTTEVDHVQPFLDSIAYRLDTSHGSVVFAGDTSPCEALEELASDADVLVMDCVRRSVDMRSDPAYGASISGSLEAGETAARAGVGHVVLVHQHPAMNADEQRDLAVADIRRSFAGKVTWAEEGTKIEW